MNVSRKYNAQQAPTIKRPGARSLRYARAMSACGHSRILELAPLASCLGAMSGNLLDMMSGTGFVAQYLGTPFQICHGLDVCETSSHSQSTLSKMHVHDAAKGDLKNALECAYDAMVSLAGFHHLLPPEYSGDPCVARISAYRTQCLRQWRELLKPEGRLVIADVPFQGCPTSGFISDNQDLSAFPELKKALAALPSLPETEIQSFQPEPACFFDQFVSRESITPHISAFETLESLGTVLSEAGYANITAGVQLTPWYFASLEEMVWFTLHLFGIGEADFKSQEDVDDITRQKILGAIQSHLGHWPARGGGVWMGWKLLYVSAENPA